MSYFYRSWHDASLTAGVHFFGRGCRIAMIDTGVDTRGFPQEFGDGLILEDDEDPVGHGTAIASLIIGRTLGLAPSATLKVFSAYRGGRRLPQGAVISCLQSAIAYRPDLIIMSLGSTSLHPKLQSLCDAAQAAGIFVVTSTGNRSGRVTYPAAFSSTLGVGAITDLGQPLPNSGFDRHRQLVDVVETGDRLEVAGVEPVLSRETGTSFAAAVVAAKLALAISAARAVGKEVSLKVFNSEIGSLCDPLPDKLKTGHGALSLTKLLDWSRHE